MKLVEDNDLHGMNYDIDSITNGYHKRHKHGPLAKGDFEHGRLK